MKCLVVAAGVALVGFGLLAITSGPSDAGVVCKKGFRVLKDGRRLGTPYCMDLYLVEVARAYGSRVSTREILNNPNSKRSLCEFIGQDMRVRDICDMVLPRPGPL